MNRRSAVFWIPLGFTVSVIDGWLSIISVVGVIHPANLLGYIAAGTVGIGMTAFAVLFPSMRGARTSAVFLLSWIGVVIFDVGTSIFGAIWYGIMARDFSSTIDFSELSFDPSNWLQTAIFIGVVLFAAYSCHKLGIALKMLTASI